MKKLLIIAALAMCCCKQQTAECPYTFMGIPIEGTAEEFGQKLIEKGFKKGFDVPGVEFLYADCYSGELCSKTVIIRLHEQCDKIHSVCAAFTLNGIDSYATSWKYYNELKELLVEKYDNDEWIIMQDDPIFKIKDDQMHRDYLDSGYRFYYNIYPKNKDYDPVPYISLQETTDLLTIEYKNPDTCNELLNNLSNDL